VRRRLARSAAAQVPIDWFRRSGPPSERVIYLSVVPPTVVLRILNEFDVNEVYTPGVMGVGVENQEAWAGFAARLKNPRPPETQTLG
jgi:hypothetical protein